MNLLSKIGRLKSFPIQVQIKIVLNMFLSKFSFLLPDTYFLINYHGAKIFLNLKESSMMRERAFEIYEYWKTMLFFNIVKKDMTIIDVGANKGDYSLLAAKLMNDRGTVISFEPEVTNCSWIKRSIEANNFHCIRLFQSALSDTNGEAILFLGEKSGWHSIVYSSQNKKTVKVKTQRLDTFLEEQNISNVDLIKIDVEGAELLVLRGAEQTLRRNKDLKIIMDIHHGVDRHEIFTLLRNNGFNIFKIGKALTPVQRIDESVNEIYAQKE